MTELSYDEVASPPEREMTYDEASTPPAPAAEQSWWDRGAVRPTTLTGMGDFGKVGELAKASVKAFGHGFEEGFGPERIGLTPENTKILQQYGVFSPEGKSYRETGWRAPFYAMNDILVQAVAVAGEGTFRTVNATYRGLQQIGLDAGLPKDVVSIPDAFMGSPHPMGVPKIAEVPRIKKILVDGGMDEAAANKVVNFATEREAPIVAFRRQAAEIETKLPPVADGSVRLWRGNRPGEVGQNPSFTNDLPGIALPFRKAYSGPLSYVDVAAADLAKYESTVGSAHGAEFLLPKELAAQAKRVDLAEREVPKPTTEELGRAQAIMERARDEAVNGIDAYHGSPHHFESFDISKIGTGEGAQAFGHGLYFAENEAVSRTYSEMGERWKINGRDYNVEEPFHRAVALTEEFGSRDKAITEAEGRMKHDPGDYWESVASFLKSDRQFPKMERVDAGNMYRVKINANREHMLDWDKPLSEQPPNVQAVLSKIEAEHKPTGESELSFKDRLGLRTVKSEEVTASAYVGAMEDVFGKEQTSKILHEAGVPGIKYLDQGSRADTHRIVSHDGVFDLWGPPNNYLGTFKTEAEAKALIPSATSNFVIFDDKLIDITHKNGEALDLKQAVDLGVVGPDRPPITEGKPADAAKRAVAADRAPDEKVTQELGAGGNDPRSQWRQRFDHFLDKFETSDEAKALIQRSVDNNNEFPAARAGDIPLAQFEALADSVGVETTELKRVGTGRLLKNDEQVRNALEALRTIHDKTKAIAEQVAAKGGSNDLAELAELQRLRMQRGILIDSTVEQVVGLRAEWGRTGNVIQEFQAAAKEPSAFGKFLKDKKGESLDDLRDAAKMIAETDPRDVPRVLAKLRTEPPGAFYWTWVNGLVSGWLTHTKYVDANALYAAAQHGVVTPLAALLGKMKQIAGLGDGERVFFGEAAVGPYNLVKTAPYAIWAALKSVKAGVRVPLESERILLETKINRRNEQIKLRKEQKAAGVATEDLQEVDKFPAALDQSVNQVTGMMKPPNFKILPFTDATNPVNLAAKRVVGAPGDAAMGIHTAFKIMGEQAYLAEEAYRKTVNEGLSPTSSDFWTRHSENIANATEDMRERAVHGAYKDTFMQELGPHGKTWQKFTKTFPGAKWVFPFSHIPINLAKATYEHTPLALLDGEMRADITGKNGGVAQDKAIARMVVGSTIMGYFVNAALNGQATGDYPLDQKERDNWKLTGKQPNSIMIGNYWVSFNKFGPVGDLANLGANMGHIIPMLTGDDDDAMTKATWHATNAAARMIVDQVGMQSLANMFEAIHDEKKGAAWVASTTASFIPFSSFLGQTASFMDPQARLAKTFVDGIKYKIPFARETLLPKRDWSGQLVDNPQHGNMLRRTQVNTDPVDHEMAELEIHPTAPEDRIGKVKLPPKMYDQYQAIAGAFTRQTLESIIAQDGWENVPKFARQEVFRNAIRSTRQAAAAVMQARNPELIRAGIEQRMDQIQGRKPTTKLQDARE